MTVAVTQVGVRTGVRGRLRPVPVLIVAAGAVFVLAVVHLGVGSRWFGPSQVLDALLRRSDDPTLEFIVHELRVPRTLIAVVAGGLLGVSGALIQAALRNPLASPEITGATGGSVLAVVCWLQFAPAGLAVGGSWSLAVIAFAGGIAAASVVTVVAGRSSSTLALLLCGVLVSGLLSAMTALLLLRRSTTLGGSLTWLIGSLNGRTWAQWQLLWPTAIVALVVAVAVTPIANVMSLGEATAGSLGVAPRQGRTVLFAAGVLASSSAVMVVGGVGFVGLMAPHIAARLVGADHRVRVPLAALLGAAIVTSADIVSQLLTLHPIIGNADQRAGIPVGAATAIVGAPLFLMIARRGRR